MTLTLQIHDEITARDYVQSWADEFSIARLERYIAMVLQENGRQNLISKASMQQIWQRHIADSAQLLEHVSREACKNGGPGPWVDLGTGPGLPGLVIAILCPRIRVVLIESRKRRVEFLERCVLDLGLDNCAVIGERIERVEPFAAWVISARAFAPLDKLMRLSAPFSTMETRYLLPKGRSAEHELETVDVGIREKFHVKHSLTDSEAGIIVNR